MVKDIRILPIFNHVEYTYVPSCVVTSEGKDNNVNNVVLQ